MSWSQLSKNPFQIFFPLGILFGLIGVGHWLLWSAGWNIPQIAITHSALQTQGFLASFVVGFLTTAFPRFTGTPPAAKMEITIMVSASLTFLIAALSHQWSIAEISFLVLMINLIVFAARRVPYRTKDLPPSFLLMGFGFLHAVLGPVLIVTSCFGTSNFALFSTGRQMVQVGFLLCMVLGVTGKLAPFLLGYTEDPELETAETSWYRKGRSAVVIHGLTGAGIMASFFIDNFSLRMGAGFRAVLVTLHLLTFARIARPLRKKTTLMFFFHLSCWMIPLGLWISFLWPQFRIAALHIVFLGGFSLMIFSFGLLIVLSHSGKAFLLNTRLVSMMIIGAFVLGALVLRFLAEVVASKYMMMIHAASGLWVLAAILWSSVAFPKMVKPVSIIMFLLLAGAQFVKVLAQDWTNEDKEIWKKAVKRVVTTPPCCGACSVLSMSDGRKAYKQITGEQKSAEGEKIYNDHKQRLLEAFRSFNPERFEYWFGKKSVEEKNEK